MVRFSSVRGDGRERFVVGGQKPGSGTRLSFRAILPKRPRKSSACTDVERTSLPKTSNSSQRCTPSIAEEPESVPFRFLDLPTEIRLQIYEYLLPASCDFNLSPLVDNEMTHAICFGDFDVFPPTTILDSQVVHIRFLGHVRLRLDSRRDFQSLNNLVLLQTCRMIHDEVAMLLYSRNSFIFNSDNGWLSFWAFTDRLVNKNHLHHLTFHLGNLLNGSNKQLSLIVRAGLEILNDLPNLGVLAFASNTDLTANSLDLVSQFCQALQNVQCSLVFNKRKCKHEHWSWTYDCTEMAPKIHCSVLSTFKEHGWILIDDFEIIDTPKSSFLTHQDIIKAPGPPTP